MIDGYATEDATEAFAQQHHPLSVGNIGTTGLTASQAGFGCYRTSTGVARHKTALQKALCEGINLIDTSSNYADENWRQVKAGNLQPRIQGVMDFLEPYGSQNEDISNRTGGWNPGKH